jgi:tetratricopeptide (TPR) repeat protein
MKQIAILVMVLATSAFAQTQPGTTPAAPPPQNQPAAQAGTTQPGTAQPTTPAGKHPLQAKTQPEYEAYNAAHAQMNDTAAIEKAANDFNTKFPDSELRVLLYRDAMHAYQRDNNGDKMMEMGRQVLKLDPDDPEAMVGVAEVLTERTKDTDLDKDQKLGEATKLAQHALETIDTNISIPAGAAPEQVDAYKRFLRSSAYAIIGTMLYNKENYKDAEDSFRKSIDAYPTQPDAVVVLRLALTLDKQNKYPEALKEVNRAVELTANDTSSSVGLYARQERDRLIQLTGGTPAPKPATGQATPPKN